MARFMMACNTRRRVRRPACLAPRDGTNVLIASSPRTHGSPDGRTRFTRNMSAERRLAPLAGSRASPVMFSCFPNDVWAGSSPTTGSRIACTRRSARTHREGRSTSPEDAFLPAPGRVRREGVADSLAPTGPPVRSTQSFEKLMTLFSTYEVGAVGDRIVMVHPDRDRPPTEWRARALVVRAFGRQRPHALSFQTIRSGDPHVRGLGGLREASSGTRSLACRMLFRVFFWVFEMGCVVFLLGSFLRRRPLSEVFLSARAVALPSSR
jgi:hypothetical protein